MAAIFTLRRGVTNASPSLVEAELYLHQGSGSIQFGSGSNTHTLLPLNAPAYGNINLIGNISASGDVRIGGNIFLGDNLANDTININSPFSGSIIPSGSNTFDLGSTSNVYRNVYANNISASTISGSFSGTFGGINLTQFSQSVDHRLDNLQIFTSSQEVKNSTLQTYTASVDSRLAQLESDSGSQDNRLDELEVTASYLNNTFSSSIDGRLDLVELTASYLNTTFSASVDSRLYELEINSGSSNISIEKLNQYTQSLNAAIELTGSTVSFLGDIVVYGTQSVINSVNLAVADNMIYLNASSSITNVDLGIFGNYNDGTYAHTGIYRDSSDGVWRVFKEYTPEASGNVDLSDPSFKYADFYANEISASSFVGIGNATAYSTSVNSRLVNLQSNSSSVNNSVLLLNQFSASVTASLVSIYQTTSSLNSYTASASSSIGLLNQHSQSLNDWSASINAFSESANIRLNNLELYSASVSTSVGLLQETASYLNTTFSTSVDIRLDDLELTSSYLSNEFSTSVDYRLDLIEIQTASFITFTGSIYQPFSTSVDARLDDVEYTASLFGGGLISNLAQLNNFTASANSRLTNLESTSASVNISVSNLNGFTSSIDITIKDKLNVEGVISGSSQIISLLPINVVSQSIDTSTIDMSITNGTISATAIGGIVSSSIQVLGGTDIHSGSTGNYQFNSIGVGIAPSNTAGRITASDDIIAFASSDIRLKKNIEPIKNALEKVEAVGGYEFDWDIETKSVHGYDGHDIGVVAQEIEKIAPELVTTRENGYKAVKYEKIVPILIQAIKELSQKVKDLEKN